MFLRLLAVSVLSLWMGAGEAIAATQLLSTEAIGEAETLLSQENLETAEDPRLIEAERLNQQVIQLYKAERYAEAIPIAEQVLALHRAVLGDRHPTVAFSLNSLAQLYRFQGRYGEAEPLYLESLEILQTTLGDRHLNVAISLNNLASLYEVQGRYGEAEPLYLESLEMKRAVLGESHSTVATSLHNLAVFHQNRGRYGEAEPLHLESLEITRTALGDRHPDVAASLLALAVLYQDQGRYGEAEPLHLESLEIRQTALGDDHSAVATSLLALAVLYQDQGRYGEAEPLYLEALKIRQAALGNRHPDVAISLNNLALLYQNQGRYGEAEPLYLESLEIGKTELGQSHPDVAISLNNLALLYEAQGRYREAELLQQESLEIWRTVLGDGHPSAATGLNNLAELYRVQGRYGEAVPLLQESLEIKRTTLGDRHPDIATSLNNLALLYEIQGRYKEAELLLQESLEIWRAALGDDHPAVAASLNNLASLYQDQGRYEEAQLLHQESLEIMRTTLGDRHPDVATSLSNLAKLYQTQGQSVQVIAALQQSLEIEEANLDLNLLTLAESQRQAYVATVNGSINQVLSVHLRHNLDNTDAAQLALTTLLRRKGRILDTAANSLQSLRQQVTPADQALLDDLSTVRSQLSTLLYHASDLPTDTYKAEFARLKAEENRLEATLVRRSAAFRVESESVTIEAVQAQIPDNTMLVELVRYRPYNFDNPQERWGASRYAAYLLSSTGTPQAVDLGEAEAIDRAVADFSRALRNPTFPSDEAAQSLYGLIVSPLQAQLGSTQHLLISPDGQLNQIPFEALLDSQQRFLIESYQISYLTSGRDLLKLQIDVPHQQPPLLIAAPDYDDSTAVAANSRSTNRRSSDLSQLRFGDLPGTAAEAAAIAPLLGVTALTGDRATENLLKQADSPQILHIATHGFFLADLPEVAPIDFGAPLGLNLRAGIAVVGNQNREIRFPGPVENPLLRSGLALAGANRRDSGDEDGILTALEAASLDLYGTQLVVLSACETGLGDVANGEGVYGLRRSLGIAGAESQMISLWQVSDRATESLMVNYYEALLAGGGRSDALRQVQLDMLQSERYAHPYYWAAFIVSGDWRPLADE